MENNYLLMYRDIPVVKFNTNTKDSVILHPSFLPFGQRKIENGEGGYCSLSCAYCYEEYFDGSGSIVGDFTSEGYAEYRCSLGHSASQGEFCEYYR